MMCITIQYCPGGGGEGGALSGVRLSLGRLCSLACLLTEQAGCSLTLTILDTIAYCVLTWSAWLSLGAPEGSLHKVWTRRYPPV